MIIKREISSETTAKEVSWLPKPGKYIAMALNDITPDQSGKWDWAAGEFLIEGKIIFIAFSEGFKVNKYFYGPLT